MSCYSTVWMAVTRSCDYGWLRNITVQFTARPPIFAGYTRGAWRLHHGNQRKCVAILHANSEDFGLLTVWKQEMAFPFTQLDELQVQTGLLSTISSICPGPLWLFKHRWHGWYILPLTYIAAASEGSWYFFLNCKMCFRFTARNLGSMVQE